MKTSPLSLWFITIATVILTAFAAPRVQGQVAELVEDLLPGEFTTSPPTQTSDYFNLGDRVVFDGGEALWVTEGTSISTRPFFSTNGFILGQVPGAVLFIDRRTVDFETLHDLWSSDGTSENTLLLATNIDSELAAYGQRALTDEYLFFSVDERDLMVTDGTIAGTRKISDDGFFYGILPFQERYLIVRTSSIEVLDSPSFEAQVLMPSYDFDESGIPLVSGESLFFVLPGNEESDAQRDLWVSDGLGTEPRKLTSAIDVRNPFWAPGQPGQLLFVACSPEDHCDLWQSDGTISGTRQLSNFQEEFPFIGTSRPPSYDWIWSFADATWFLTGSFSTAELWRVDNDTNLVEKIYPTCSSEGCSVDPESIVFIGEKATYSGMEDGERTRWISDGTVSGTRPMAEICAPRCHDLYGVGDKGGDSVFFVARDPLERFQLWRTDGTPGGTTQISAFQADQLFGAAARGRADTAYGAVLSLHTQRLGRQPWVVRNDPPSTASLGVVTQRYRGSKPQHITGVGDRLLVTALESLPNSSQRVLFASDSEAKFQKILPDELESTFHIYSFDSFALLPPRRFGTPWLAIGPEGTEPVPIGVSFGRPLPWGDGAVLPRNTEQAREIWETDGTQEGTRILLDSSVLPNFLLDDIKTDGDLLYFSGDVQGDSEDALALWKSDGTLDGTSELGSLGEAVGSWTLSNFFRRGEETFFLLYNDFQTHLWKLVGPDLPPQQVGDSLGNRHLTLLLLGDRLVAFGSNAPDTRSLYALHQDGAHDLLLSGGRSSSPDAGHPAVVGDEAFFALGSRETGHEIWVTDGTLEGSRLVADIQPGLPSSFPTQLTAGGDVLYFTANDGAHGRELWKTDGTEAGTRLVHDIYPGAQNSDPQELTVVGDRLYFTADDGLTGRELWVLPLDGGSACRASEEALCLKGDRFKVEARWKDFQDREGTGKAVELTGDTGYFWFFNDQNVESVLKVLDGQSNNEHFWTFFGALSNVEYNLTVTDTATGLTRRYFNPAGTFSSVGDTRSFGPLGASLQWSPDPESFQAGTLPEVSHYQVDPARLSGSCAPSSERLCLNGGRFAVETTWTDFQGNSGNGQAVDLTQDTGYFWFFKESNVELVLKVLDGRANNGNYWVFYGSLSNVDFDVTVTDTETGQVRVYRNRSRQFASVGDTRAFPPL